MRCSICPRRCDVDRTAETGFCGAVSVPRVARADLHFWEEPCISGTRGSGAVFFSGCNMACEFCQNFVLQSGAMGQLCPPETLSDIYLSLQARGAHNINLVTGAPHIVAIAESLRIARGNGLTIPVVYNTNAYETVPALRMLEGLVDIYLPDLKYVSASLSAAFSGTPDYSEFAIPAISEMLRQVGHLRLDASGLASRGLLIRYLVLPNCVFDARSILDVIKTQFTVETHLSIMRQYTPTPRIVTKSLNRFVTQREYDRVLEYAQSCGFSDIFIQDAASANLEFTPIFTDSIWK